MARYLSDNSVFEEVSLTWQQTLDLPAPLGPGIKAKLLDFGYKCGDGVCYNYGIWKPKKLKFRFIAGTRAAVQHPFDGNSSQNQPPDRKRGPPRSPMYFLCKDLVRLLNVVIKSLKEADARNQAETGLRCFWGIDSINEFTRSVRVNADFIASHGMATYDFSTMYTAFPLDILVHNVMSSVREAMEYEASKAPGNGAPTLTVKGWSWSGDGMDYNTLQQMLHFSVYFNFIVNGDKLRRQVKGIPMGLPHAPQLVTLACYPVEKSYVLATRPTGLACRYIDDFFVSRMTPPPQEDYFMEYKLTSTDPQRVVYLGVEVLVRGGKVHTSLYDREEDYPFHIVRYPDWDTVAPLQQHGGVLMGRFVACQEACTYLQDFKESVANVVRRALQRHYPKTLVANVWSRFLEIFDVVS